MYLWGIRWARALPLVVALAGSGLGCAAFSAMGNPKAAWALNEPAKMSAVVRRAEVAQATALQVKRLLSDTGVDIKSSWVDKVAVNRETAQRWLELTAADPVYAGSQLRLVTAEAWAPALATICSSDKGADSLLALISPDVAEQFQEITQHDATLAELRGQIEKEKAALAAPGLTPEKRREHMASKKKLEADLDRVEDEIDPKVKALLKQIKTDVPKAPPAAKEKLALAALHLQRAVADAKLANSTAMIRYPLAMPSMSSDVQDAAKRFAADVVEEKTGTRPDMSTLSPGVTLDGADVKVTLNGVPADKLGGLSADELVAETTKRTKDYVAKVLDLPGVASQTQETLSFQEDLLGEIARGAGVPANAPAAWDDLAAQVKPAAVAKASRRPPKAATCDAGALPPVAKTSETKLDARQAAEAPSTASSTAPSADAAKAPAPAPGAKMELVGGSQPPARAPSNTAAKATKANGQPSPARAGGNPSPPADAPKGEARPAGETGGPDLRLEPAGR